MAVASASAGTAPIVNHVLSLNERIDTSMNLRRRWLLAL
jgi:hypothetical protein